MKKRIDNGPRPSERTIAARMALREACSALGTQGARDAAFWHPDALREQAAALLAAVDVLFPPLVDTAGNFRAELGAAACLKLCNAYTAGGDGASIDWQDIDDAHALALGALNR